MGLGGGPGEWDDYEWFSLAALPAARAAAVEEVTGLGAALVDWLDAHPVWRGRDRRLLLVDLDNLRADPRRWRARMTFVLALASGADEVALAGQAGAVRRARLHLGELAARATAVADGSDLADYVLLEAAARLRAGPAQIVVLSNDGIFASLADRGRLVVVSPGGDALSDRLAGAADLLVDLARLEAELAAPARAATERAAAATKTAAKELPVKRLPVKRLPVQKVATKKVATKKVATKKVATKKVATKKVATKATTKATPKKAVAKKPVATKAVAKKPAATKAAGTR